MAGDLVAQHPGKIREILNFEDEFNKVDNNVFPLLGRYAQYILYERQKACYCDRSIKVFETGNITGLVAASKLRAHISSYL